MSESDLVRLRHMLDAAREALQFLEGGTPADSKRNRVLTPALVKEREIIGEAASKLADEVKPPPPKFPGPLRWG